METTAFCIQIREPVISELRPTGNAASGPQPQERKMMKRVTLSVIALLVLLTACSATTTADCSDVSGELNPGQRRQPPRPPRIQPPAPILTRSDGRPRSCGSAGDLRRLDPSPSGRHSRRVRRDRVPGPVLGRLPRGFPGRRGARRRATSINFTVRVPTDELTATLAAIRQVADRVVTESLQSQDVTEQFVDIEAQLRNLHALEIELLALLAELRDNPNADPAKLLQVFDQIRITRGEIEQLEGRKQSLTNLVALATISIGISPLPAAIPIIPTDPVWEPATVAKEALRNLVEALQVVGNIGIRLRPLHLAGAADRGRTIRRFGLVAASSLASTKAFTHRSEARRVLGRVRSLLG